MCIIAYKILFPAREKTPRSLILIEWFQQRFDSVAVFLRQYATQFSRFALLSQKLQFTGFTENKPNKIHCSDWLPWVKCLSRSCFEKRRQQCYSPGELLKEIPTCVFFSIVTFDTKEANFENYIASVLFYKNGSRIKMPKVIKIIDLGVILQEKESTTHYCTH